MVKWAAQFVGHFQHFFLPLTVFQMQLAISLFSLNIAAPLAFHENGHNSLDVMASAWP